MPTLLSAVSLGLALIGGQGGKLNAREPAVSRQIRSSVVTILRNGSPIGTAVLIDGRTMFLAHQNVVGAPPVTGRAYDGTTLQLVTVATDTPTQLVLLRADRAIPGVTGQLLVATGNIGKRLLAVVPSGIIKAELAGTGRMGMMNSSQRLFTLNEIQFESPTSMLAGAPVFNMRGELVGLLGAAIESPQPEVGRASALPEAEALGDFAPKVRRNLKAPAKFGPGDMTVAYSVTPDVLARVVRGFLSPSRQVSHPVIGVLISDADGGGVKVEAVQRGSSAEDAGFKIGDVVVEINSEPIANKIDYGRVMARQSVGSMLRVIIRRGDRTRELRVRVGG